MANYITNVTIDGTQVNIKDAETSNNLTEHINANNPHHISKDTIGLGKLQNVEYIPKNVDACPSGDALDLNYWKNLGTGIYFASAREAPLANLPVDYAYAIVCTHDNDVMVILHEQPIGRTFILSGGNNGNSGWIEFAMKSNNDTITNATIDSI